MLLVVVVLLTDRDFEAAASLDRDFAGFVFFFACSFLINNHFSRCVGMLEGHEQFLPGTFLLQDVE